MKSGGGVHTHTQIKGVEYLQHTRNKNTHMQKITKVLYKCLEQKQSKTKEEDIENDALYKGCVYVYDYTVL